MGARVPFLVVLVALTLRSAETGRPYDLIHADDGFSIHIENMEVLKHTLSHPFVYIGKGQTEFNMLHGNFHISDETYQRVPLLGYYFTDEAYDVIVTFFGSSVEMKLKLSSTVHHKLTLTFGELPEGYDRVWVRLPAKADEHIFGAGEQFSYFDLRGRTYPIWVREQGVGRNMSSAVGAMAELFSGAGGDYHTTYFPQSTFVSSRGYYCHVTGSTYKELNFRHDHFHEVLILGQPREILFDKRQSMPELVGSLSGYFGRQPPLPDWIFQGAILGVQGGTERVLGILDKARSNGVSVSALWIQDWSGKILTNFGQRVFWNWEWNPDQYPGLDREIQRLRRDEGVRLLAYITPHLNRDGRLFQIAEQKGYLVKHETGDTYLIDFMQMYCGTVDLTMDEAKEWYKDLIKKNLIAFGFGGWMADFSEYIPVDFQFANGERGNTMHNAFPVLWAQTNREAVEEAGVLGNVVFYMRAGGPGSQRFSTLMWAGDQNVDFSYSDGLASTIPAALSLGLSGSGLTHYDIGGYTTVVAEVTTGPTKVNMNLVRSEELFIRGAEAAVFTPVMRTHEGNRPDLNFQVYSKEESLQLFAVFVDMYTALQPYTKSIMAENSERGLPLQRPLFLHYEDDVTAYEVGHQYLYGRDLLVAPVLTPGVHEWRLYLPRDEWRYLHSDEPYSGGQWITVPAHLGSAPVFYRSTSEWADLFRKVARIARAAGRMLDPL